MNDSPVRVEEHQGGMVEWKTSDLLESFLVVTSLPCEDINHRRIILGVIDSVCLKGGDLIGQDFYVGEYVVHPVKLTDKHTGKIKVVRRCVLPQPDGPAIAFCSEGVIESIGRIAWSEQLTPPFDPPIKVRLVQRPTGSGGRVFKLVPLVS